MAIKPRVRSIILSESLGVCALCRRDVGADGEVAHIVAETYDGPRGDDPLPLENRNEPENLLYLCVACHREGVDKYPAQYPVSFLRGKKLELQQIRKEFNNGRVNYYNSLFHRVSPERLYSVFNNACLGKQIQLSYEEHNCLILFNENNKSIFAPAVLRNDIDAIKDSIILILGAFDEDGEEFQCSPFDFKMRLLFYNENDPKTFHRRDEFWLLYGKIATACTRAMESIRNIVHEAGRRAANPVFAGNGPPQWS